VYFTVRGYPRPGEVMDVGEAYDRQRDLCEDLVTRTVGPNVIAPIATTIAPTQ